MQVGVAVRHFLTIVAFLTVFGTIQADAKARKHRAPANREVTLFDRGGGYGLIAEMRRHLGTNPTGRRRKWCAAFLDMALRNAGYQGGGNLAFGYKRYGRPADGPCVGCIAVFDHSHVGVMTGTDNNGNPIFISGNDSRLVRERARSGRGVIAWRVP